MIRVGRLSFPEPRLPETARDLRRGVREFLTGESFTPRSDAWLTGHDPAFSRRLAAAGFVGMTIPTAYGGHGRTWLERYVVVEELLAAGAPVAAHWHAERQVAPLLMRFGTESQRERLLPLIACGELFVSIGMSEPNAGSDLAAIRTRAEGFPGGYRVYGQKIWTSHAHRSHFMLTLCRTDPAAESRHDGLSQVLVELGAPGTDVRPIRMLNGEDHFSEVFLDGVVVASDMLVGTEGSGWSQVMAELAYERSGPERVLTTFPLLAELIRTVSADVDDRQAVEVGRLVARTAALQWLSRAVATGLDGGRALADEAALVKEIGTRHEQDVVEGARAIIDLDPRHAAARPIDRATVDAVLAAPGFTLRGGTNEILRGIVSRAVLGRP